MISQCLQHSNTTIIRTRATNTNQKLSTAMIACILNDFSNTKCRCTIWIKLFFFYKCNTCSTAHLNDCGIIFRHSIRCIHFFKKWTCHWNGSFLCMHTFAQSIYRAFATICQWFDNYFMIFTNAFFDCICCLQRC